MTDSDFVSGLIDSCFYIAAAELIIRRDALLAEANRVESWNAPWARNRRREAAKLFDRAKALCGDRPLPWGVQN